MTVSTSPSSCSHLQAPAFFEDGGAEGVRTPDLLNAIQALYQLSYDPNRSDGNLGGCHELSKRNQRNILTFPGRILVFYG